MKYLFIIFFSMILISCAGTQETKREEFQARFVGRQSDIQTLGAVGSVMMSFPQASNTARFKLSTVGTDSLLLEIYGPFGINIGKLYARQDYFLMLNTFNAEAYEGIPDEESLKAALNLPVSFYDFIRLFRNESPGEPDKFELMPQNPETIDLLFSNKSQKEFAEFAIYSSEKKAIVQYQKQLEGEGAILNTFYSNFAEFSGKQLPKKIVFRFPKTDGSITFEIENYVVNEPYSSRFSFSLPSSIKPKKLW